MQWRSHSAWDHICRDAIFHTDLHLEDHVYGCAQKGREVRNQLISKPATVAPLTSHLVSPASAGLASARIRFRPSPQREDRGNRGGVGGVERVDRGEKTHAAATARALEHVYGEDAPPREGQKPGPLPEKATGSWLSAGERVEGRVVPGRGREAERPRRSYPAAVASPSTRDEAAAVQRAALRRLGGEGRVALAFRMTREAREIATSGLQRRHPELTREQARLRVIRRALGEELFASAYGRRRA